MDKSLTHDFSSNFRNFDTWSQQRGSLKCLKANSSHGEKPWVSHRGLSWLHCNHASICKLEMQKASLDDPSSKQLLGSQTAAETGSHIIYHFFYRMGSSRMRSPRSMASLGPFQESRLGPRCSHPQGKGNTRWNSTRTFFLDPSCFKCKLVFRIQTRHSFSVWNLEINIKILSLS